MEDRRIRSLLGDASVADGLSSCGARWFGSSDAPRIRRGQRAAAWVLRPRETIRPAHPLASWEAVRTVVKSGFMGRNMVSGTGFSGFVPVMPVPEGVWSFAAGTIGVRRRCGTEPYIGAAVLRFEKTDAPPYTTARRKRPPPKGAPHFANRLKGRAVGVAWLLRPNSAAPDCAAEASIDPRVNHTIEKTGAEPSRDKSVTQRRREEFICPAPGAFAMPRPIRAYRFRPPAVVRRVQSV